MTDHTEGDGERRDADPPPALPPRLPPPPPPPPEPEPPPPPPAEAGRTRSVIAALTAGLVVILAGLATAPYWAPPLVPLLPWGHRAGEPYRVLAQRVDSLEQRLAAQPAGPPAAPEAALQAATAKTQGALAALGQHLDQLTTAEAADRQALAPLPDLARRVAAIDPAALGKTAAEVNRLDGVAIRQGAQLDALAAEMRRAASADNTDAALALSLGQLRAAVSRAQPFTAEYDAFRSLAGTRPALAEAAAPLAAAAAHGVAGDAALAERLQALGASIVAAGTASARPAAPSGWRAELLARVRGLVTIRHIGGPATTHAEAAVTAARNALAEGDIAAAATALGRLQGAQAAAASPWLEEAHARLAVDATLDHLQQALIADLAAPPGPKSAPAPSPAPTPAAPAQPEAASPAPPAAGPRS